MVEQRKVVRIESRCILCGSCYKYCPHGAVQIQTGVNKVLKALDAGEKIIACLDPTFPAVLDVGSPGQLVTALKKLGFQEVWESALGGDLISREYRKRLWKNDKKSYISSFCPSVVLYTEKFAPQLVDRLVPVVSPMLATGKAIKKLRGEETKVVFVGSCISRIYERRIPHLDGIVDCVLTYHDIRDILDSKGIDREAQAESPFDGPQPGLGRLLSVSGGMSKCIGFEQDLVNLDNVITAGPKSAIRAIQQLQDESIRPKFLDVLFCQGCIDGPIVDKNISGPSRKQIVVDFFESQTEEVWERDKEIVSKLGSMDLERTFSVQDISLPEPKEEEIQAVLTELGKTYPNRNLDCGACGFNTCREKAIAVVQGLAEKEMCLHYLLTQSRRLYSRLDKSHRELQVSHNELEQAQKQLIQSEKLASIGQLAAGVAHELNNPLGTITLFSGMLKKDLPKNEKWEKDINLIIQESERAAKIVKDLLSFSRETKLKPGLVNVNSILEEAVSLLITRSLFRNIQVKQELESSIPTTFADPDLLKQVFFNIILNGAQAMDGKGTLTIKSQSKDGGKTIEIQIQDSGKGIAEDDRSRIFDPFFTTKEKGTGLGLALVYGIVSKHKGTIDVESELGKGATFFINLPVLDQQEWEKGEQKLVDMKKVQTGGGNDSKGKNLIGG
jgi:signal transduction histidine kinase/iron only hydrogenase large subunit-like protein